MASAAWGVAGRAVATAARAMMEKMNCMLVIGWEAGAGWFGVSGILCRLDEELMAWIMRVKHMIVGTTLFLYPCLCYRYAVSCLLVIVLHRSVAYSA